VSYLTIQKEEDITVNPIFKKEVSYRQALESELARTSVERSELQEVKVKYNQMEENMERMLDVFTWNRLPPRMKDKYGNIDNMKKEC